MSTKRTFLAALLAGLLVLAFAPSGHTDASRPMLVRVHVESRQQAAYLMSYFDETHNHAPDEIELLLWPGDRMQLESLGFDYEVVVDDLFEHDMREGTEADSLVPLPGPDYKDYRTLADYNREMKKLAKKHPRLVKLFKMRRKSHEGRSVFGIEIASNVKNTRDGRPIFYMDGVHHAREWPASEYTMIYAHYLVQKFGKDRKITKLLRRARVIAVPVVNPDGFEYSRESVLSATQEARDRTSITGAGNGFEGYWRKNRKSFTGATAPTKTNPDAYGVDPNRNYPYLWGDSNGGSSGLLFDQTYRGDAPFSEPETKNVRDIILGRPVVGVITNHTYQGSVLRTGGGKAPEDKILYKFGQKMANILRYRNASSVGYPTTGTTDDWAYAAMGALGYTIENGLQGFHPGYDKEVGAFWKQHMRAFDVMLKVAANPKYHSVIKGRVVGGRAKLTIKKKFKTPLSPGNPTGKKSVTEKIKMGMRTKKNGSFVWHLGPSSRPYEKKAESFTLKVSSGSKSKALRVRVGRGMVKKLGRIRL